VSNIKDRNQIFAFRTTKDFTKKFDELCDRLGYCRSKVVRYVLKQFVPSNWNNTKSFNKVKQEMF
jgi:hypothetical protein